MTALSLWLVMLVVAVCLVSIGYNMAAFWRSRR